ncbi:MAG: hypothetical protein QXU62_07940, partial [Thermofilaceae archaeon]
MAKLGLDHTFVIILALLFLALSLVTSQPSSNETTVNVEVMFADGSPCSDCSVFVNGYYKGNTDASGKITLTLKPGDVVKAEKKIAVDSYSIHYSREVQYQGGSTLRIYVMPETCFKLLDFALSKTTVKPGESVTGSVSWIFGKCCPNCIVYATIQVDGSEVVRLWEGGDAGYTHKLIRKEFSFNAPNTPGEHSVTLNVVYDFRPPKPGEGIVATVTLAVSEPFLVKVSSPYGTTSGSGWYMKGARVTISVSPVLLDHGNGTRRVFSGWYDEKGVLLSREPVFSLTVDKPLTVTARWDTEYKVEAYSPYGSATGSGWYKRGVKVTVSVSPVLLDHGNGTRRVFSGWYDEKGVLLSREPVFSLTVDKPLTVTARWDTEYRVEVSSLYGTTSGSGWYEKGSKVTILVSPSLLDHGNRTRRVFSGWYDEGRNLLSRDPEFSLSVDKPFSITAKWDTEYRVEVYSPYGSVGGSDWYKRGSTVTVSVSPILMDHGNWTRRVFSGWYDEKGNFLSRDPVFSLTVDKPLTVTAKWDTEYRVEIYSPYGLAVGSGWYQKGSTATVLVSPATVDAGFFMEYVFEGWVIEGWLVSASPVYSFTVDRPVTLTARWVGRVKLANVFALVVFAMLAVGLLWRSRVSTRVRRETRVVVEGVASEEVETRVAVELERLRVLEEELEKVKGYLSKLEEEWKKGTISTDAYEILKKEYQAKIEQLQNEIKKIRDYE